MAQLGYTWYPKDWFTSNTRKRLKRFPMVRYTLRELFDLIYMEGGPIEMNREYLIDDLDIVLTDKDFDKLMEYIEVQENGKWYLKTVKSRVKKAEAARQNGAKGGRPKKTQKPSLETQDNNPKNPSSEIETKEKEKEKQQIGDFTKIDVVDFDGCVEQISKNKIWSESFYMQFKLSKGSLSKLLKKFIVHLNLKIPSERPKDFKGFINHFTNWCNTQDSLGKLTEYKKYKSKVNGAL